MIYAENWALKSHEFYFVLIQMPRYTFLLILEMIFYAGVVVRQCRIFMNHIRVHRQMFRLNNPVYAYLILFYSLIEIRFFFENKEFSKMNFCWITVQKLIE